MTNEKAHQMLRLEYNTMSPANPKSEALKLALEALEKAIDNEVAKAVTMRLIDADALEEEIDKNGWCISEACDALGFVRDAPTVDAEPVKHGYWEWVEEWGFDGEIEECYRAEYVCSACKKEPDPKQCYDDEEPPFEYCPHCGVKMDFWRKK